MRFVATKRLCPYCKKPIYPGEWDNHFRVVLEGILESFAIAYGQSKNEQSRTNCIKTTINEIVEANNGR